jgi:dipeptidase E
MSKLFLSSVAVTGRQGQELAKLVGKPAAQIKVALIENAADPYPDYPSPWVLASREAMSAHGFKMDLFDLKQYKERPDNLKSDLGRYDVIWLAGGNTYYLRWLLRETGADLIISDLVKQGTVYGGGSAGAIMAGPTLKFFEVADDPKAAPQLILEGLSFTDQVVVPHADSEKYADIMKGIIGNLEQAGYSVVPLKDSQALIVDGSSERVI